MCTTTAFNERLVCEFSMEQKTSLKLDRIFVMYAKSAPRKNYYCKRKNSAALFEIAPAPTPSKQQS